MRPSPLERAARAEAALRPWLVRLPPAVAVRLYSAGRRRFLERLEVARPPAVEPPAALARTLWGIDFRAPLANAAGMFKNGGGYELAVRQGAGAWLAGTTTATPRRGNRTGGPAGAAQPFAPFPRSAAAANWLGLPNDGHRAVAVRLGRLAEARAPGCPIGASLAADPEDAEPDEARRLAGLVEGLALYEAAGADFLELNESCPNTGDEPLAGSDLARRLERIAERFLARRRRPLPVLVKVSSDTEPSAVPALVDLLLDLGFDGVTFGNTSTAYARHRDRIVAAERPLYDHFVRRYGGGLSGHPLAADSLALGAAAAAHLAARAPLAREFHVVRAGGISGAADLAATEAAGIALGQWYTGYFEAFARDGHGLYRRIHRELAALREE